MHEWLARALSANTHSGGPSHSALSSMRVLLHPMHAEKMPSQLARAALPHLLKHTRLVHTQQSLPNYPFLTTLSASRSH